MLILKLENNLFCELDPNKLSTDKIRKVTSWVEKDSVFRSTPVDFFEGVKVMTMEKRKFPFFYKYYLYFNEDFSKNIELQSEQGAKFVLAFYNKYFPEYVKNPEYNDEIGMKPEEYFYMEKMQGAAMQHFVPGKGLEEELEEKKPAAPVHSGQMEGYHPFKEGDKDDFASHMDALKSQFADQLKDLEALMAKKE